MDLPPSFEFVEPLAGPTFDRPQVVKAPRVAIIQMLATSFCFVAAVIALLGERMMIGIAAIAIEVAVVALPTRLWRPLTVSEDLDVPIGRLHAAETLILIIFTLCLVCAPDNVARLLTFGGINVLAQPWLPFAWHQRQAFLRAGLGRDTLDHRRASHQKAVGVLKAHVMNPNPAPLVVYLRAFGGEDVLGVSLSQRLRSRRLRRRTDGMYPAVRPAEIVAQALSRLASDGGEFSIVVAARNTRHYSFFTESIPTFSFSDHRWMEGVRFLLDHADAIVILAEGRTDGLRWERETVMYTGHARKTLEIAPETPPFDQALQMAEFRLTVDDADTLDAVAERIAHRLRFIVHRPA